MSVTRWKPLSVLSVRGLSPICARSTPIVTLCKLALPPDLTLTFVRTVRRLLSASLPPTWCRISLAQCCCWCSALTLLQSCSLYRHSRVNGLAQWGRSATTDATCRKITSEEPHTASRCQISDRNHIMAAPNIMMHSRKNPSQVYIKESLGTNMTSYQKQDLGLQLGKNGDLTIICCEYLVFAQVLKKLTDWLNIRCIQAF